MGLTIYLALIHEEPGSLWHRQFADTLEEMGHTIIRPFHIPLREIWFIPGNRWGKQNKANISQMLLDDVKKHHSKTPVDLFFCYLYDFQFDPAIFKELDKLSIPSVYFFCDYFTHPEIAKTIARHASLSWVPELKAVQLFEECGASYIYLPMAANPRYHQPAGNEIKQAVSFIGNRNVRRAKFLADLIKNDIPLSIYGSGWLEGASNFYAEEVEINTFKSNYPIKPFSERLQNFVFWKLKAFQKRVFPEENLETAENLPDYSFFAPMLQNSIQTEVLSWQKVNLAYNEFAVTLGINDTFHTFKDGSRYNYPKMRDFEAPMSGACYLTQSTPEAAALFEENIEVMRFSSAEELTGKALFLLKNDSVREKMRIAARKRALAEHTWQNRFTVLFEKLCLKSK